MESIIAAHLPDLETWQSLCLLFDNLPPTIVHGKMLVLFNRLLYKQQENEKDVISLFSKQGGLQIEIYKNGINITIKLNKEEYNKTFCYDRYGKLIQVYNLLNLYNILGLT